MRIHPLDGIKDQNLNAFTLDVEFKVDVATAFPSILSYATKEIDGEFQEQIILFQQSGRFKGFKSGKKDEVLGSVALYRNQPNYVGVKRRLTITGDETGGKVYYDKIPLTSKISDWRKIPLGGSWVLGQQQDSLLGGYDETDRLIGSICNFQMWDFKMSNEQLDLLFSKDVNLRGNIFDSPPSNDNMYEIKECAVQSNDGGNMHYT